MPTPPRLASGPQAQAPRGWKYTLQLSPKPASATSSRLSPHSCDMPLAAMDASEVVMFRSLAMSFACFPLLTSFITASQSTLLVAKAELRSRRERRVAASIDEAAASCDFLR